MSERKTAMQRPPLSSKLPQDIQSLSAPGVKPPLWRTENCGNGLVYKAYISESKITMVWLWIYIAYLVSFPLLYPVYLEIFFWSIWESFFLIMPFSHFFSEEEDKEWATSTYSYSPDPQSSGLFCHVFCAQGVLGELTDRWHLVLHILMYFSVGTRYNRGMHHGL